MKPQRVISAVRGWEYFAKDYFWTLKVCITQNKKNFTSVL